MRELNRLGVTSAIDAGGGFQNYPDDYAVIQQLSDEGQLTVRIAYNLFTQKPKAEREDFLNWTKTSTYKQGDEYFRHNGAGEMLVFSAADFEDFRQPRPDMEPAMEGELEGVIRLLAQNRWPWRLHATYDETISRALDVFERVNQEIPLEGLHWFFDHAETISEHSIDRIAALGGGIAVQHRMAYQGEYFVERYGPGAAQATPPVAKMLERGVKTSAGTDATRVASYNPWVSLAWLITGKTVGGLNLYPRQNCLDRDTALRMWTENGSWFSNEEGRKGRIAAGQLADLIVPDRDFFSCPEHDIAGTTALLTVVGGNIVYGAAEFARYDENAPPPAMPDWSPVRTFGGYGAWAQSAGPAHVKVAKTMGACQCVRECTLHGHQHQTAWTASLPISDLKSFWGALGCSCWAI
jgi:predicted amidohydrolase YtcJ